MKTTEPMKNFTFVIILASDMLLFINIAFLYIFDDIYYIIGH
jgi:hypothetical protein